MKLTDKQENFSISYVANGGNATAAYKECYNVGKDVSNNTIWVAAHKVLHNNKVSIRIDELRKQRFSTKILSIEERKIILSELGVSGDKNAIDLLNKMEGIYIEKRQLEHSGVDGNPIKTENKWTIEFIEAKDEQSTDTK